MQLKRMITAILLPAAVMMTTTTIRAQEQEAEQLLLNVEKLAQLKTYLNDLQKTYQTLAKGYQAVQHISEGNFKLHDMFLDGLLQVSPAVKNYYKVKRIIQLQLQLVKLCKMPAGLQSGELSYVKTVADNLIRGSLQNLEQLSSVLTATRFRMSESERIQMIDRLYAEMEEKVLFARSFSSSNRGLIYGREKELSNLQTIGKWHSNKY